MRVFQVMAGGVDGGAETAFVDMCLAQREAGMEIAVATRPHPARVPRLLAAGIPVYMMRFGGPLDFRTTYKLRRAIAAFQPQIVQTWMSRAAQKTPRWHAGSGTPRYLIVSRLGGYYAPKHFPRTDYFTTITPDIRRFLIEAGIVPDRVHHINNFAEVEAAAAPADRAVLHTPAEAPLLLALGRLHRAKAFDVLLQALAALPGAYLWIAGEGPERAALTAQCTALGLDGRVRFLGWRDDRAALFQAADICVFPSRYEPFGTVFVQAWAAGRALVAAAAAGPRQYVRDGEDGLLVPTDDALALAAALRRLCGDADLRARLVASGRARYLTEFTQASTVKKYYDFYHTVLTKEGLASEKFAIS